MKISLRNVSKRYKGRGKLGRYALKDFTTELTEGVYGLLGANGAGKTTLINIFVGILDSDGGTVLIDGQDAKTLGKDFLSKIGYMPQYPVFYRDFTVMDFLLYMCALKGIPAGPGKKRALELLDIVNLSDEKDKKIGALSGGMRQRVGIVQAMLGNPEILILDEPTAGLDPKGRDDILEQVAYLHRQTGMTVILVSHSMEDIARYADRIIVMNHGEVMYNDKPKSVFAHYRELEQAGLAAPQVTYIMHDLRERGLSVDIDATTVSEAADEIVRALGMKTQGNAAAGSSRADGKAPGNQAEDSKTMENVK